MRRFPLPRRRLSLALAVLLHAGVGVFMLSTSTPRAIESAKPQVTWSAPSHREERVTIELQTTPPPELEQVDKVVDVVDVVDVETPPKDVRLSVAPPIPAEDPPASSTPALVSDSPSSASSSSLSSSSSSAASEMSPGPRGEPDFGSMGTIVMGLDARGPAVSVEALGAALDYQPAVEEDQGLTGARLAAARANRALKQNLAFHDVTMGMASDWFRELDRGIERGLHPSASDLDNPNEVSRAKIMANYLTDPTSWDDEAKRLLLPRLQASATHSTDPVKRLALGNSANLGAASDSTLRAATVDDLLRRKEAGLSVRFAFEVDVHHDGAGAITAIDVLRTSFQKQLVEKMRMAITDAVEQATPAPALVNHGKPFKSTWLLVATWFIDPPMPMLTPSDAMEAIPGVLQGSVGGTFEITDDGIKTSSFEVQQKVDAQLLRVSPIR